MIVNLVLLISLFDIFLVIYANERFHFGIINHYTQWYFHCPNNTTKISDSPSNDQPLISYECPLPSSSPIEILPIEIDFTFLCRLNSRFIWLIIDLYQSNTYFSLITSRDIEIKINLNNHIHTNNFKSEMKNFPNHSILINAFYIPFESIEVLLNQPIEMNIIIRNVNQWNQCQFFLQDIYLWQTFINDQNCNSVQSSTLSVDYAQCHFYSMPKSADKNHQIVTNLIPDLNKVLSIDEDQLSTRSSNSTPNTTLVFSINSTPSYNQYFLSEETYRQVFASIVRSTTNSNLLKLTFLFLVIILIILILFFLYMLYYHYHLRLRSESPIIGRTSV